MQLSPSMPYWIVCYRRDAKKRLRRLARGPGGLPLRTGRMPSMLNGVVSLCNAETGSQTLTWTSGKSPEGSALLRTQGSVHPSPLRTPISAGCPIIGRPAHADFQDASALMNTSSSSSRGSWTCAIRGFRNASNALSASRHRSTPSAPRSRQSRSPNAYSPWARID